MFKQVAVSSMRAAKLTLQSFVAGLTITGSAIIHY